jgi:hypothetical protein
VSARLSKLKTLDLDKIGPEMERMGDEIEKEMEGLDKDLAQLNDKLGKSFAKKFGKDFAKNFGPSPNSIPSPSSIPSPHATRHAGPSHDDGDDDDDDDDDDDKDVPSVDTDVAAPSDMTPAIAALKGIDLDPHQKEQLARLRVESDRKVGSAKRELEQMSSRLHDTLLDGAASEDEIARQIDSISAKEAFIRKARILTWVKARNVLRTDQRKMIETAVKKSH